MTEKGYADRGRGLSPIRVLILFSYSEDCIAYCVWCKHASSGVHANYGHSDGAPQVIYKDHTELHYGVFLCRTPTHPV